MWQWSSVVVFTVDRIHAFAVHDQLCGPSDMLLKL